jgi:hypothetical protein
MNKLKNLLFLGFILFVLASCHKEDRSFYDYPEVDDYIQMLKEGTYSVTDENGYRAVPNFRKEQISELLEYVDDLTIMPERYPIKPIASANGSIRLGEGLLWTIEGIARNEKYPTNSGNLVKEAMIDGEKAYISVTDEEVLEVAKLYKLWWNGQYPFNKVHDKNSVHPLEDTPYLWN